MSAGLYDALSGSSSAASAIEARPAAKTDKDRLTHDDFLRLLVMQLTHQDPLKPMEDVDFMAQLAQMQALDEQIAMTQTMRAMRIDTQLQATSALIGKLVSGADENGNELGGVVDRVVVESDAVYAQLANGLRIPTENIRQVWHEADTLRSELAGAQSMIGLLVTALDDNYITREGIAVGANIDSSGVIWVALHNGQKVRYNDIYEISDWIAEQPGPEGGDEAPEAAESSAADPAGAGSDGTGASETGGADGQESEFIG